jgi:hypothetical protein
MLFDDVHISNHVELDTDSYGIGCVRITGTDGITQVAPDIAPVYRLVIEGMRLARQLGELSHHPEPQAADQVREELAEVVETLPLTLAPDFRPAVTEVLEEIIGSAAAGRTKCSLCAVTESDQDEMNLAGLIRGCRVEVTVALPWVGRSKTIDPANLRATSKPILDGISDAAVVWHDDNSVWVTEREPLPWQGEDVVVRFVVIDPGAPVEWDPAE